MSSSGNENAPEETHTYTVGRGVTKRHRDDTVNTYQREESPNDDGGADDFVKHVKRGTFGR